MTGTGAKELERVPWRFWVSDHEAVLGVTLMLVIIGSMNIFSSSFVVAGENYDDPYFFVRKQGLNLAVGFLFFLFGIAVDYHILMKARNVLFWAVAAMLAAVFAVGVEVNGAQRWLAIGGFQLQPAELAKPTAIFLEAYYIAWRIKHGMRCNLVHTEMIMITAMFVMVEREPDMGTAMIILCVPLLMLFCSNMKTLTKIKLVGVGLVGVVMLCIIQPYRLRRVMALLDPWEYVRDVGYQIVQSIQAIGSGGLLGMGMGMGVSKYHYLPEAHTDFAFSIWCQEMGFVGAAFVMLLFVAFAFYGVRIANSAKDAMGQMLAFGMTMLIIGQACINLLMISGCVPVVGVPLPFISYGGTSLFVSLFAVGVLANVGARSEKKEKPAVGEPPREGVGRPRLRRVK